MIRVRFAPSPTGHLHIGGVRTALFNYLYVRNQGGQFIVRIEDTDRERSSEVYEKEILDSLTWLGLRWDGEIIRQSSRLEVYRNHARTLIDKGLAYEETKDGKTAVRFKMPKTKAVFFDLVHGETAFDASLFEDLVILKSDGYPTYHWACVVDDHEMEITHVIRGDDHISNTPRQIFLYEAMGWKPPKFAHLPLIMGNDGTPLSKRHGAVSLDSFQQRGFIPEGILNYLALLGWGTSGNEEFYTLDDLVAKFSLKRINKANARFNLEKMEWLNAQHLKRLPEEDYLKRLTDFFPEISRQMPAEKWKRLLLLYRGRIKTLKDLADQASYCFSDVMSYDEQNRKLFLENKVLKRHLEAWLEEASRLKTFDQHEEIEKLTRETAQGWGIEARDLIHPLRFAITGKTVSPGLFELMSVLGKETTLKRLRQFLLIR